MGFTHKCFIRKNTPELREKVYSLGTTRGISIFDDIMGILCANENDIRCWDDEWGNADKLISKGYVDCGTNEELFLAIASMRDDSDYMQLFISNKGDFHRYKPVYSPIDSSAFTLLRKDVWHKATVEELIKYFTK